MNRAIKNQFLKMSSVLTNEFIEVVSSQITQGLQVMLRRIGSSLVAQQVKDLVLSLQQPVAQIQAPAQELTDAPCVAKKKEEEEEWALSYAFRKPRFKVWT